MTEYKADHVTIRHMEILSNAITDNKWCTQPLNAVILNSRLFEE